MMHSESNGASDTNAGEGSSEVPLSRYESQKKRDWITFLQYLKNHKPPLSLSRCSGAHVIEFMKYLDQFGKTKVHVSSCTYFGCVDSPGACSCPLKQAWGSLDALIGRLRAAYQANQGGHPDAYEKKRKRMTVVATAILKIDSPAEVQGGGGGGCSSGDGSTGSA